jgi:hypothetical protein
MKLRSSFISSSKFGQGMQNILYVSLFLLGIDLSLTLILMGLPNEHALQRYFNYGASTETKLARMFEHSDSENTSHLSNIGWPSSVRSSLKPDQDTVIIGLGLSFTDFMLDSLEELRPDIGVIRMLGPGAPISHSVSMYEAQRKHLQGDFVVLGLLSSSIGGVFSMTTMISGFESCAPYTFPRYSLEERSLKKVEPVLSDKDDFIQAFHFRDTGKWGEFLSQLEENDAYYDPLLFKDRFEFSNIVKLLRRAWASSRNREIESRIQSRNGYEESSGAPELVRELISHLNELVTQDGRKLYLVLHNTYGSENHLYDMLAEHLREHNVPFINTNSICSNADINNFAEGGHFTKSCDEAFAMKLLQLMKN